MVENGRWTLSSNHAKQAELALVKSSSSWEAACHKVNKGSRRLRVEAQQLLKRHLVVVVDGSQLTSAEDKGSKATEEDWKAIQLLNFQRCRWIASVAASQTSRQDSMHGSGVGTDAGKNCRHGTRACGAHYTDMLSLLTERYWKALK